MSNHKPDSGGCLALAVIALMTVLFAQALVSKYEERVLRSLFEKPNRDSEVVLSLP